MVHKRKKRITGVAYLVMDGYWYSLPVPVREAVYWGFHNAYTFGGVYKSIMLVGVDSNSVPAKIDFVDAIVQVYKNESEAKKALINNVSTQITQIQDYHLNLPKYCYKPLGIGRTFTLKEVLGSPSAGGATIPICVTESVIALNSALGWWRYFTREKRRQPGKVITGSLSQHVKQGADVKWLKTASIEWQKWFGISLGRMIAHEVWHQIWSQDKKINTKNKPLFGAEHPGKSWALEEEGGGRFWHKKVITHGFGTFGQTWIRKTIPKLDQIQGRHETYSIDRR